MRISLSLACLTLPLFGLALPDGDRIVEPPAAAEAAAQQLALPQLQRHDRMPLALPADLPEQFDAAILLDGEPMTLRLSRHVLRSPAARLLVDRGNGRIDEEALPPSRTYRGSIVGEPLSAAAGSLLDAGLVAVVERGDGRRYHIEPLSNLQPLASADADAHLSYRADDVVRRNRRCGNDELMDVRPLAHSADGQGDDGNDDGGVAGATKYLAEIAFDADFEFYQKNASSVAFTVADIESVMNQVEFIYDRDVDISYELVAFVVRTSASDPYSATASSDLLCEFRSTWNAAPENQIQREVAHLFTGKSLDGTTIGVGWIEAVCNQSGNACSTGNGDVAYSLVESKFGGATFSERVALSCHELGHNWGASHCDGQGDCHIMCSSIGNCDGLAGANLKFGVSEQADIVAYGNTVSCDLALSAPLTAPFGETWPGAAISTSKWVFSNGGALSTTATNEPSAPNAIDLDATGAGAYEDDEIRSHVMLLGGTTGQVALSYHTQHKGVENGETLLVEYWSSAGAWVNANTILSGGTDQTAFAFHSHALPASARHDQFRVRFRTEVNEANDDWYVDDIAVNIVPFCPPDLNADGTVDADDLAILIGAWGPCASCNADLNGSGSVNGPDITLMLAVWGGCS